MQAKELYPNLEALILAVEYDVDTDLVLSIAENEPAKEILKMINMSYQGYKLREIADHFDIDISNVRKKLSYYYPKNTRLNEIEINEMIRLFNEGYTNSEIARELNRSTSTVVKKLSSLGYNTGRELPHHTKFKKLYNEGKTDKEIANLTGKTKLSVAKWRQKRKLKPNKEVEDAIQ